MTLLVRSRRSQRACTRSRDPDEACARDRASGQHLRSVDSDIIRSSLEFCPSALPPRPSHSLTPFPFNLSFSRFVAIIFSYLSSHRPVTLSLYRSLDVPSLFRLFVFSFCLSSFFFLLFTRMSTDDLSGRTGRDGTSDETCRENNASESP